MLNATLDSVARATSRSETSATQDSYTAQSHLIAIVAHELRNPLVPLRNVAAMLKHAPLDAITQRRAADIIDRQVIGMIRLIDDLVDVSKLRCGSLELLPVPVTLAEIVERCVEMVGTYVSAHGHKLVVEVSTAPVHLTADAMRICQALQNLVANAAKYTNKGGRIRIRAYAEDREAVIVVTDNGIGMSAEQLKTIFDMFAQVGQSGTVRSEGGLGIGLFLTRYLVEAHKGAVTVTSAGPGNGSEFTVRLPCGVRGTPVTELRTNGAARATDRTPS
ncbi:MAG: HAMP domain-containing sensor histidine kinase [Pseudomonadota bacterium]